MKSITKHIPNFITCLNLLCGAFACIPALGGDAFSVFGLLVLAAIFDFFDGFASRKLDAYSPMGKELDSLADGISFGLVPGLLVYAVLRDMIPVEFDGTLYDYLPYVAFVIPVFSALRLAKFNVDERQSSSFIGMPTPANALFWISVSLSLVIYQRGFLMDCYLYSGLFPAFVGGVVSAIGVELILLLVVGFSLLMVSEIPMFSFKLKSSSFGKNKLVYLFLCASVVIVGLFTILGLSFVIILYVCLSVYQSFVSKRVG